MNLQSLLYIIGLLVLCSCQPRGETKSLDEVLRLEKSRYTSLRQQVNNQEIGKTLDDIQKNLEELMSGKMDESIQQVATDMRQLLPHAGITSRAAMDEVAKQYESMKVKSGSSDLASLPPQAKLLAARTYSILSAELKAMQFRLEAAQ